MKKLLIIITSALIVSCGTPEVTDEIRDIEDTTKPYMCVLETMVPVSDTAITVEQYIQLTAIEEAVGEVESGCNNYALNKKTHATGYFQITQIMLKEYFKCTGVKYSLHDMYDYEKAREVFDYMVVTKCGFPVDVEKVCRMWYGKGKGLKSYTERVFNIYIDNVKELEDCYKA